MSYKKVGGLHFFRFGRLGFSFFVSKRKPRPKPQIKSLLIEGERVFALAAR